MAAVTHQDAALRLPSPGTTIAAFLDERPEAAPALLAIGMACVGCSMARFDTLADAARAYGLALDDFLHRLAAHPASPSRRRTR